MMIIPPSRTPMAVLEGFLAKSMAMARSSAGKLVASTRFPIIVPTILGGRGERETEPLSSSMVSSHTSEDVSYTGLKGTHAPNTNRSPTPFHLAGTAIVISAVLNDGSNLFNVTLDGVTTSVNGARPSGAFVCDALFSQSGLDETQEHEISVVIGGPSPTANATLDDSSQWSLLLDNFM